MFPLTSYEVPAALSDAEAAVFPQPPFDRVRQLLALLERGAYHPTVTKVVPLQEVPAALRDIVERRSIGRVVASLEA